MIKPLVRIVRMKNGHILVIDRTPAEMSRAERRALIRTALTERGVRMADKDVTRPPGQPDDIPIS